MVNLVNTYSDSVKIKNIKSSNSINLFNSILNQDVISYIYSFCSVLDRINLYQTSSCLLNQDYDFYNKIIIPYKNLIISLKKNCNIYIKINYYKNGHDNQITEEWFSNVTKIGIITSEFKFLFKCLLDLNCYHNFYLINHIQLLNDVEKFKNKENNFFSLFGLYSGMGYFNLISFTTNDLSLGKNYYIIRSGGENAVISEYNRQIASNHIEKKKLKTFYQCLDILTL